MDIHDTCVFGFASEYWTIFLDYGLILFLRHCDVYNHVKNSNSLLGICKFSWVCSRSQMFTFKCSKKEELQNIMGCGGVFYCNIE